MLKINAASILCNLKFRRESPYYPCRSSPKRG